MTIKDLKKGDYFTLKPIMNPTENQVYVRGDYDFSEKRYMASKFSDFCSSRSLKPSTVVYTDFVF